MISITKAMVPFYLRTSEFYSSLDVDGGDIPLPADCFKECLSIVHTADLRQLLSTLRYWGVQTIPAEIVQYILFNRENILDDVPQEFEGELLYGTFLLTLRKASADAATSWSALNTTIPCKCQWPNNALTSCAKLCYLQFAHTNGKTWNVDTCALAAKYGNLSIVQWLHQHGSPWDNKTCVEAARQGRLDALKYAHENGCPWGPETCSAAAAENNHQPSSVLKICTRKRMPLGRANLHQRTP